MKIKINVDELKLINKRITELKKKYKKVKFAHIGELYKTLNEIVNLRKKTNSRYTERSLENEKGLNISANDIRVFFAYPYISDYGHKMIEEGKIEDIIICRAIRNWKDIRDIKWQNKYIEGYINGDFIPSSLSELNKENVRRVLLKKTILGSHDSYFKAVLKSLRNTKARLKKREKALITSPFKEELRKEVVQLYKYIRELK